MAAIFSFGIWLNLKMLAMLGIIEIVIALIIIGIPIWCLVDILKSDFKGNNKIVWILIIIFLNILGVILYKFIGEKQKVMNTDI